MSDPRFTRLRTDPRFRRPKKHQSRVVVDERFKEIFENGKKNNKRSRVDKYGRAISDSHERDNLRQFYRLGNAGDAASESPAVPDYARGGVLLESSDEEDDESDDGKTVTLGYDQSNPIPIFRDEGEAEIDLDEGDFADLDAQAAAYASKLPQQNEPQDDIERTSRIAVVNLDWDHVRAMHLYKIFSSLVSQTAPPLTSSSKSSVHPDRRRSIKGASSTIARGKVLNVRVYPSEFGKERMAKEETEGPPMEVFKRRDVEGEEEINEKNIYEFGDGDDYDEDALRNYQLGRLRYYYAIVTCDTVDAASHIYSELEGTELERSANVFDLSFVPDGMTFNDECRDEASDDPNTNYKAIEFVTDALRHSKVKLTWDEDDPDRNQITRRTLTKQEIEEADFKAYLASSTSGSESEFGDPNSQKNNAKGKTAKGATRDKLRALLLRDDEDDLPEGWGRGDEDEPRDIDMEITFTPGLSEAKDKDKEETTLEKYARKMKEKRKKRKEELKERAEEQGGKGRIDDDFFDAPSEGEEESDTFERPRQDKFKAIGKDRATSPNPPRHESTVDELALLVASDNPSAEPEHFNMKSVLKAEKKAKGKWEKRTKKGNIDDNETQRDFVLDVNDDRFKAVHEDHKFAIDPSNPHFKKTKGMAALLDERSKREKSKRGNEGDDRITRKTDGSEGRSLTSLIESVKRKSAVVDPQGSGKRRRV